MDKDLEAIARAILEGKAPPPKKDDKKSDKKDDIEVDVKSGGKTVAYKADKKDGDDDKKDDSGKKDKTDKDSDAPKSGSKDSGDDGSDSKSDGKDKSKGSGSEDKSDKSSSPVKDDSKSEDGAEEKEAPDEKKGEDDAGDSEGDSKSPENSKGSEGSEDGEGEDVGDTKDDKSDPDQKSKSEKEDEVSGSEKTQINLKPKIKDETPGNLPLTAEDVKLIEAVLRAENAYYTGDRTSLTGKAIILANVNMAEELEHKFALKVFESNEWIVEHSVFGEGTILETSNEGLGRFDMEALVMFEHGIEAVLLDLQELSKAKVSQYLKHVVDHPNPAYVPHQDKRPFIKALQARTSKRVQGKNRAIDKLVGTRVHVPATEEVIEADLQELSKERIGKYIEGAAQDKGEQAAWTTKLHTTRSGRPKRGHSKEYHLGHDKYERREKGIHTAVNKLTGKAKVNATEEVNEISKGLASRYALRANREHGALSFMHGNSVDNGDVSDHELRKTVKKSDGRERGVDRAVKKLSGRAKINATEEVVDEAKKKSGDEMISVSSLGSRSALDMKPYRQKWHQHPKDSPEYKKGLARQARDMKRMGGAVDDFVTKNPRYKTIMDKHKKSMKEEAEVIDEKHIGFKKLEGKLAHEKGVTNPAGLAAAIGRKKYGAKKFNHMAHEEAEVVDFSSRSRIAPKKKKKVTDPDADVVDFKKKNVDENAVARAAGIAARVVTSGQGKHGLHQFGDLAQSAAEYATNKVTDTLSRKLVQVGKSVKAGSRLVKKFTKEDVENLDEDFQRHLRHLRHHTKRAEEAREYGDYEAAQLHDHAAESHFNEMKKYMKNDVKEDINEDVACAVDCRSNARHHEAREAHHNEMAAHHENQGDYGKAAKHDTAASLHQHAGDHFRKAQRAHRAGDANRGEFHQDKGERWADSAESHEQEHGISPERR